MSLQLVWFRNDLRKEDNTALIQAIDKGPCVAIYIATPDQWQAHDDALIKIDFWRRNLTELQQSLKKIGVSLFYFQVPTYAIAGRMSTEDTFVFFFSGHGDQVTRADGFESSDPDGQDEIIELYDGAVLDNELNDMLAQIDVGKTLIILDSCFSGGFSKDVISVPGRMGLFSSEEDVTSQVAFKFQAGGYLSYFFEEALTDTYADSDQDGSLNAIELSQFLHERFRLDVKSFGDENYVTTGGPQSNYQHLVVDRGSLDPFDILF
ncbi:MAG: deoxyribodipyrimidine photo-lyase [Gammaproteobacteria bacterium]|jgi:hypothetical protein|nr:deoxyribodipyrimidine photo-lyase [Gammaproteobacteria bacterium]